MAMKKNGPPTEEARKVVCPHFFRRPGGETIVAVPSRGILDVPESAARLLSRRDINNDVLLKSDRKTWPC